MKSTSTFLVAALAALLAVSADHFLINKAASSEKRETRWEHIKKTGVLRCAYGLLPPFEVKDPNTGKISGLYAELLDEIGKQLTLKIEWVSESTPATMATELNANKFDMVCAPYLRTPSRAREASYTISFLYHPTYLYARVDDDRFDNAYDKANAPDVTFSAQDGDFSAIAATTLFPKAKMSTLPQISAASEQYVQVADKKADLIAYEAFSFHEYDKSNPGKMRQVKGPPLMVQSVAMPIPANEPDLKEAIDSTLIYLMGLGYIDRLLDKYETPQLKFLRLPKPYLQNEKSTL